MKRYFGKPMQSIVLAFILLICGLSLTSCKQEKENSRTSETITEGESDMEVTLGGLSVKGKKVAFVGDGFTVKTGLAEGEKDYVDLLSEQTGLIPLRFGNELETAGDLNTYKKNKGYDGTTSLSHLLSENPDELASCPVLVLWLGTQDYYFSMEIGETEDTDSATFCGGLNRAISLYREKNPEGEVVLVTPLYRTARSGRNAGINHVQKFLLDYREAVISVAVKQQTYLVDPYYLFDAYSLEEVSSDGLYVNGVAHEKIAACFTGGMTDMTGCETLTDAYSKLLAEDSVMNPLNMKDTLCVFYGDSISARAGFSDTDLDYKDRMQSKLQFTFKSFAIGGTTYAAYNEFASQLLPGLTGSYSVANILKNRLTNAKADVAFLMYGTNDYHFAIEIGELGSADVNTVYGAMQTAIDTLRAQNPDIQIVVGTPIARTIGAENPGEGLENALGYVVEDYTEAIIRTAEANGVWLCRLDRLFTPQLYTFDVKLDDVHASPNGHKLMADFLIFNTEYTG